jgi:hypothetical protein
VKLSAQARSTALVLASVGASDAVAAWLASAAPPLAAALEMGLKVLDPALPPQDSLAPLAAGADPLLAVLPRDPGLPLESGGHWAEALGAWRQPTLLLLPAGALRSGAPAAAVALLQQWRVPLLGLVQGGGDWRDEERRRDGLPWLGWLPEEQVDPQQRQEALLALVQVLQRRRRQLEAELE